MEVYEGRDLTTLFHFMAERLINFDEDVNTLDEKEQNNSDRGTESLKSPTADSDKKMIIGSNSENDIDKDQGSMLESGEDLMNSKEVDQDQKEPWPLNILAFLIRIGKYLVFIMINYLFIDKTERFKKLAIQNQELLAKLLSYDIKSSGFCCQFLVAYLFSHLVQVPGTSVSHQIRYSNN